MSLPDIYKAEFAQKFLKGSSDMKAVYNVVRIFDDAHSWRTNQTLSLGRRDISSFRQSTNQKQSNSSAADSSSADRSPKAESWGHCDCRSAFDRQLTLQMIAVRHVGLHDEANQDTFAINGPCTIKAREEIS